MEFPLLLLQVVGGESRHSVGSFKESIMDRAAGAGPRLGQLVAVGTVEGCEDAGWF